MSAKQQTVCVRKIPVAVSVPVTRVIRFLLPIARV
jgi:hypothetical protein